MTSNHILANAIAAAGFMAIIATGTAFAADTAPVPPHVIRGNTHIIVGVTLNEAAVRSMLPDGIQPVDELTGGVNVYTSQGGYGSAAYTRAYVWADIKGFDSADGSKGRWAVWGVTDPGADTLRKHFGFPMNQGQARLDQDGDTLVGTVMVDGADIMTVAITPGSDPCEPAAGILNYPGRLSTDGQIVNATIPWAADICGATPGMLDVAATADADLIALEPVAVWAIKVENGAFSLSEPAPLVTNVSSVNN